MKSEINYVTYQTFPAKTANSIQTISNIKYFVKNGYKVNLYFPMREITSSNKLDDIQEFYQINETFEVHGLDHKLPHGRIKIFKKYAFNISHYLWAKKTINKYFNVDSEKLIFTRSDWIAFFGAKKGHKIIFECHQRSKVRDFVIKKIGTFSNVNIIFLNDNLKSLYPELNNSYVLQNGVDHELFKNKNLNKRKSIVFVGNLSRFSTSRGLPNFLRTYSEEKVYKDYIFEIVGGNQKEIEELESLVVNLNIKDHVIFHGYMQRKKSIEIIESCSIGLLINTDENEHSTQFTSPLKYFEYLYGGLNIIASDFPSHRSLPYNEKISFFDLNQKRSLSEAILNTSNIDKDDIYLKEITIDKRVKEIIKLFF